MPLQKVLFSLAIGSLTAGPLSAWAQVSGLAVDAPICENRGGGTQAGDRLAACSRMLSVGGLTPAQESMVRMNRAWAFSLGGRMAEARADYDRALALNPNSHVILNERGLFNLRVGRLDDAIADYDRALALAPNAAFSLYGRGLAWLRKGDTARGEDDLAEARRADSNVDSVFRTIGMGP